MVAITNNILRGDYLTGNRPNSLYAILPVKTKNLSRHLANDIIDSVRAND